ncbi:MAG TPA: TRAP transporter small permease [Spirochaetales bacterium]|nr:TRAP transporter small permease [Spirochaetales bacterium]HOV38723.1 TRAP transporter small permease [Spirochaetales bacterium]
MPDLEHRLKSNLLRVQGIVEKILNVVVAILLVMMSVTVFMNVIFRYFLNQAIAWYEEVSRFLLIWIVFLGAVLAYIRKDHLGLDVILYYLKPRAKQVVILISDLLVIIALGIMVQGGFVMALDSLASGWVASSVPIPYGWVYMIGPISSLLMLFQAIVKTVDDLFIMKNVFKGGA